MEFNFDEWADLHKADPAAFEKKRISTINAMIDEGPEHLRDKMRAQFKKLMIATAGNRDNPMFCAQLALNAATTSMKELEGKLNELSNLIPSKSAALSE